MLPLKNIPKFKPGDTVKVHVVVKEGDKERIQIFEGVCIARHSNGTHGTFTVRKMSSGIGVERVFPYESPAVAGVDLVKVGKIRRAKLYYMRNLKGKASRIEEVK